MLSDVLRTTFGAEELTLLTRGVSIPYCRDKRVVYTLCKSQPFCRLNRVGPKRGASHPCFRMKRVGKRVVENIHWTSLKTVLE